MRVVILINEGPRAGSRWLLRTGENLTFGRSERSDVILPDDPMLSSRHFQISVQQDHCSIEDQHSTNGTWVNEAQVQSQTLSDGDQIRAGHTKFVFRLESAYNQELPNEKTGDRRTDLDAAVAGQASVESKPAGPANFESANIEPASSSAPLRTENRQSQPRKAPPQPPPREITYPNRAVPGGLQLQVEPCNSGLFRATQVAEQLSVIALCEQLASRCSPIFIVDFLRTGLVPPQPSDEPNGDYVLSNLSETAAMEVSPRMLHAESRKQSDQWLRDGWGQDGILVLFSLADVPPLLEHLQGLMQSGAENQNESRGIMGLCWPSVLGAILQDGKPSFVAELIEPYEAILVESAEAAGGWALFGDNRLSQLLTSCRIPLTTAP